METVATDPGQSPMPPRCLCHHQRSIVARAVAGTSTAEAYGIPATAAISCQIPLTNS